MKISKIKIKNYRSVKSEVAVDVKNSLTIIGPNNSGKTNFLKGIALFFSAFKSNTYSIENDLSFGVSNEKTSIVISFSASQELDEKFLEKYRGLAELLEENKDIDLGNISLYLNFSSAGRPSYRFFTNDKVRVDKKDDYQKLSEDLVFEFLDNFSCKYIPSEKSTAQLFDDFLLPHLREYVGKLLQSHEKEVSNALDTVSDSIAKNMSNAGLSDISCKFSLPGNLFSKAINKFDFLINDGEQTTFSSKGSGIQAATILSCFDWISGQEIQMGKNVIWLIEEPESYLHPELTEPCSKILQTLSEKSDIFITTHAIGFIPQDYERVIQATLPKENGTTFGKFKNYADATHSIRSALGVRFSDYYSLTEYNVFVEGKTDKMLIQHLLGIIKPKRSVNSFEALRKASIIDFSGTGSVKDFIKSTYAFMEKERSIVAIFDGDDAGLKATKDLGSFFHNKGIDFNSNKEYIILPNRAPIEALFPSEWLVELSNERPNWMRIQYDVRGNIVDLNMQGDKKVEISRWLIRKSNDITASKNGIYEWAKNFIEIFKMADDILLKKHQKILTIKNQSKVRTNHATLRV